MRVLDIAWISIRVAQWSSLPSGLIPSAEMRRVSLILIAIAFMNKDLVETITGKGRARAPKECLFAPENRTGSCINIRTCPTLLQLLTQKPVSAENTQLLREAACGFEGKIPKVCCPEENEQSEQTTTETTESSSDHPNRHLFPEYPDCGFSVHYLQERIIGGEDTKVADFPWVALLGYRNHRGRLDWRCGGSLISDRYVLTAAHCIYIRGLLLSIVRLGEHTISNEKQDCSEGICAPLPQDMEVESAFVHPEYGMPVRLKNDIGLIRLRNPANMSIYVRPICLPFGDLASSNLEDLKGVQLSVAGWGYTTFAIQKLSDVLQKLEVPVVPLSTCQKRYRNGIQLGPGQVCAGGSVNRDFCMGDSGGPLMLLKFEETSVMFRVVGVVSAGTVDCGDGSAPGVYTRVGAYLSWITDNVSP